MSILLWVLSALITFGVTYYFYIKEKIARKKLEASEILQVVGKKVLMPRITAEKLLERRVSELRGAESEKKKELNEIQKELRKKQKVLDIKSMV